MQHELMKLSMSVLHAGTQNEMQYDIVTKAVLFDDEGRILLLKRSATDKRRPNQWDLPGGHVDEGEMPADAVIREIWEESGLHASIKHLVYAKTEIVTWQDERTRKHRSNTTWQYFICVTNEKNARLSHEHSEYCWIDLKKALELVTYDRHLEVLRHVHDNQLEI